MCGSVTADEFNGGYAGAFFQIPIGARPTAMGGAYIAVSNDGAGILFNPAGLANLQKPLFATSYRLMQLDRRLGYAGFIAPVQGEAVLGVHWLYAGTGNIDGRRTDGELSGLEFSLDNHDFSIIFAKRFERYMSLGVKLNYLYSRFVEMSASSVGFDFGAMFYLMELIDREERDQFPVQDMQVGLTVKGLGMKYQWDNGKFIRRYIDGAAASNVREDKVPIEVGLGASARFFDKKLLSAVDVVKNEKQSVTFRAGLEYYISRQFAIRGGYGGHRFAAGTGYIFKLGDRVLAIDYAFSTDKADEGSEHIFSFDILF
jgi:hypothetical protein